MRIALFTDGLYPFVIGGIQRHSHYLLKHLIENKIEVDLYHTASKVISDKEVYQSIGQENCDILHIEFVEFPRLRKLPGHYVRSSYEYSKSLYFEFLKRPKVDVVYSKNYSSWYFLEEKVKGKILPPIGTMLHGYEVYQIQTGINYLRTYKAHKRATDYNTIHPDFVYSYGGKITDIIRGEIGVAQNRIIEIPTGIDKSWISHKSQKVNSKKKLVFIGRYTERKGIHLIDKFLKSDTSNNWEMHFIGAIPDTKKIVSSNIIYHGELVESDQIQTILDKCDILLCPSKSEGMPNVIVEGMARGCAIIATDVGAASALVSDGNGRLIEPVNYKAFEGVLLELLSMNDNELEELKNNSISKVESEFLWDRIVLEVINSFEKQLMAPEI